MNGFRLVVLLVLLPVLLGAQDLFGGIAAVSIGTDDGTIGSGLGFGGGLSIPLAGRWTAEADAMTVEVGADHNAPGRIYTTRRTMVVGSVLYRWCGSRACVFAGSGLGSQFVSSLSRIADSTVEVDPSEERELRRSGVRRVLFAPRLGASFFHSSNVGVRVDAGLTSYNSWIRLAATYRIN